MDDRTLALCELQEDLLYHRIPADKLACYVDACLAAGREAAKGYAGADMIELYKKKGIQIIWQDSGETRFGVTYRGQSAFGKRGCEVALVRQSIRELAANSTPPGGGQGLSEEKALAVHLAHEFFHYLEYERNDPVSGRLPPVVTLKFLGLARRARINKCSEVAAHAFAREVTGLSVLPNYYDYLYLMNTGQMGQEAFEAMLARNAALLAGG